MKMADRYQINVSEEDLEKLYQKLELTSFPFEQASTWDRGIPLPVVKRLVERWRHGFDWRKVERELNDDLPQFLTTLSAADFEPMKVHFVHSRSKTATALPLLLIHGWPSSFLEVRKVLQRLYKKTDAEVVESPAFHVVAISLPGYAFSDAATKPGFTVNHHAEICHKLMISLGYTKYVTFTEDLGYVVGRCMAIMYPGSVCGQLSSGCLANEPTVSEHPEVFSEWKSTTPTRKERTGMERQKWFLQEGSGYAQIQSTKPQTLAYSLADSPVALLAWIAEKLHDWTDCYPWDDDEILTWVSIFWFSTAGPAASIQTYYENAHDPTVPWKKLKNYIPVKMGIIRCPKDLFHSPQVWAKTLGEIVLDEYYDKGGHFPMWECPDKVVESLRQMFGRGGGAYGVIDEASGYA